VNISATITDPNGTVTALTLVDTGQNGDGIADDGTYSAIVDYTMNGIYTIKVMVDNAAQTARFTMEGFAPAHSTGENGEMPPPPVFLPITENFTRNASVQLVVSGVVPDDHSNSAPGTPVTPNNSDVPGRIEVSGDVDVFTVATGGLDYLIFRVTGLAFGMEPRLRILDEDGTTEIVAATINDLLPGETYLTLAVPVNGRSALHAEVSHANSGTGMYQFSAGKPILSDSLKVSVDIRPQSCPNPIYTASKGVLPVAILGTDVLDVTQIDPATVRLNEVAPLRWSLRDKSTPFVPFVGKENCEDCNELESDGYLDLTLKFNSLEVVAALGGVNDRDCIVLTLTGSLKEEFGGAQIIGEDVVVILKKR
jgi:hypothetical protein